MEDAGSQHGAMPRATSATTAPPSGAPLVGVSGNAVTSCSSDVTSPRRYNSSHVHATPSGSSASNASTPVPNALLSPHGTGATMSPKALSLGISAYAANAASSSTSANRSASSNTLVITGHSRNAPPPVSSSSNLGACSGSVSGANTAVSSTSANTDTAMLNVDSNASNSTTVRLLSELERSWAMFAGNWKVIELFAGLQVWQEQTGEIEQEPLNSMLFSMMTTGLIMFLAASIGGAGFTLAIALAFPVVFGTFWSKTSFRAQKNVPSFKTSKVIRETPIEVFKYIMNLKNLPIWDSSVEKAHVIHTIDDHADIIYILYRPVWMWPLWVTPRDLCLLRYWRKTSDGTFIICMQSAIHPECPPLHGIVRAQSNGGGFTIAPNLHNGLEEPTSLVTNVIHMDPLSIEGYTLRRLNALFSFLKPQIMALTGLEEILEARKFACVNIAEEFTAAIALADSSESTSTGISKGGLGTSGAAGEAGASANATVLRPLPVSVPTQMWCETEGNMLVRGPDYGTDRRKIPSEPPFLRLVGVDLLESANAIEHIASKPENIVQKELRRYEAAGQEMPFTFVINFVIPGTPRIALVLYYQAPNPSVLNESTPFAELMAEFLDGPDEFRNERFKLIPRIVDGPFIVRQAVGTTPAITGNKLRQPYYRGKQYFEVDIDISSSVVANRVVGLVSGYTKKLVIEMGFVLEGRNPDELPERLFGTCRLIHLDMAVAKRVEW